MPTDHSELVGTTDKGSRRRKGRVKELGASVENFAQQLEKDQLAIAELYQENRVLQRQLVEKKIGDTIVARSCGEKHLAAETT